MKDKFFEGADFKDKKFKALLPEFYPLEYQKYIEEETGLLKKQLSGAERVLEAGVGVGRIIPEIAPLVNEFVGIDNADLMLAEARKIAKKFPNVKIIRGDLETLGTIFPEDYFDYSLCIWNTLGNVKDELAVLTQLARVTLKGVIVTTYLRGTVENRKNWYKAVGVEIIKIDEQNDVFYSRTGLQSKSYGPKDMVDLARRAGICITNSRILAGLILWTEFRKFPV